VLAQARLIAWASTNVANLEHEPAGPLLVSAFVTPGYFATWPVLIALALFGANRALGNVRTALVCLAGHVIGSLVSESIVVYRIDVGRLPAADRHLSDVGPSYLVLSAIVIALACGTWLARTLAAVGLVLLVFPGQIFAGLSELDVTAVGHLTAMLAAAVTTALVTSRWPRRRGPRPGTGSAGHVTDGHADQVGDGGEPEREGHHLQADQVRDERDDRADRERGQRGARRHHRRGQLAWIHP